MFCIKASLVYFPLLGSVAIQQNNRLFKLLGFVSASLTEAFRGAVAFEELVVVSTPQIVTARITEEGVKPFLLLMLTFKESP